MNGTKFAGVLNLRFTCAQAKEAGFTCAQAKEAGFTCAEAKEAGFTPSNCEMEAGYTRQELINAGWRQQRWDAW